MNVRKMPTKLLRDDHKAILKLCYGVTKEPKHAKRHYNRFIYRRNVLRTPRISFTPPVFIATIAENCNLACPSCVYLLKDPDKFYSSFIDKNEFLRILEKHNKEKMAETIFLTGGEPLLHPEIDEIIDICKKFNLSTYISTNGILVKSRIASMLKLDYVNVSVDSYDYETFKKNREGSPTQFDLIRDGLKALKENDIHFSMSYLLSRENMFEVYKMLDFAESIEPDIVCFHNINPHGDERYRPLTMRDADVKLLLNKIVKRTDYPFDISLPVIFNIDSLSFDEGKCIQPWNYFCFNSKGDVSFCCHLAHSNNIGNVFTEYNYNSSEMVSFRRKIMENKRPDDCLYCQRRFFGKEYGCFSSRNKKWRF